MPRGDFIAKKWMGDDMYSWAVFRRGAERPCMSGMSMYEARWRARKLSEEEETRRNRQKILVTLGDEIDNEE